MISFSGVQGSTYNTASLGNADVEDFVKTTEYLAGEGTSGN